MQTLSDEYFVWLPGKRALRPVLEKSNDSSLLTDTAAGSVSASGSGKNGEQQTSRPENTLSLLALLSTGAINTFIIRSYI